MTKYRCVIADDDVIERDLIEMYVGKVPELDLVARCADGLELLHFIQSNEVDLVFSDIEMPELSGFSVLNSLATPPVFIFISAYTDYAVESYNMDVVDFLHKPVTFQRFLHSVEKAFEYLEIKTGLSDRPISRPADFDDYFFVIDSKDMIKINYNDVLYIESMGDFSRINTVSGKKHLSLISLKNLEIQLPSEFYTRTHKQYLINHSHIIAITPDEIKMKGDISIPYGHFYKQALIDKIVKEKLVSRYIDKV